MPVESSLKLHLYDTYNAHPESVCVGLDASEPSINCRVIAVTVRFVAINANAAF